MLFLKYLDDLEGEKAQEAELKGESYEFILDDEHRWSTWAAPKKEDGRTDHDSALTGPDLIDFVKEDLFPHLEGFKHRAESPDTIEYKIGEIFGEIRNKFNSGYSLRDALDQIDELGFRSQKEKHELSDLYESRITRDRSDHLPTLPKACRRDDRARFQNLAFLPQQSETMLFP